MTPNGGPKGPAGVEDVLRTEQISMSFGPVVALRSVDLHLPLELSLGRILFLLVFIVGRWVRLRLGVTRRLRAVRGKRRAGHLRNAWRRRRLGRLRYVWR